MEINDVDFVLKTIAVTLCLLEKEKTKYLKNCKLFHINTDKT